MHLFLIFFRTLSVTSVLDFSYMNFFWGWVGGGGGSGESGGGKQFIQLEISTCLTDFASLHHPR